MKKQIAITVLTALAALFTGLSVGSQKVEVPDQQAGHLVAPTSNPQEIMNTIPGSNIDFDYFGMIR